MTSYSLVNMSAAVNLGIPTEPEMEVAVESKSPDIETRAHIFAGVGKAFPPEVVACLMEYVGRKRYWMSVHRTNERIPYWSPHYPPRRVIESLSLPPRQTPFGQAMANIVSSVYLVAALWEVTVSKPVSGCCLQISVLEESDKVSVPWQDLHVFRPKEVEQVVALNPALGLRSPENTSAVELTINGVPEREFVAAWTRADRKNREGKRLCVCLTLTPAALLCVQVRWAGAPLTLPGFSRVLPLSTPPEDTIFNLPEGALLLDSTPAARALARTLFGPVGTPCYQRVTAAHPTLRVSTFLNPSPRAGLGQAETRFCFRIHTLLTS
jgi:hypothetical protein